MPMSSLGQAFEREVRRINLRFNQEIIEGLNVCPYARVSREKSESLVFVRGEKQPTVDILHGIVDELIKQPHIEVAQVIFPRAVISASDFLTFATHFGETNAARTPGQRPAFVHAAFHPELPYSTETGPQLVSFFRRSPDPMIQLIRLTVLDSIHASKPRGTQFFDGDAESFMKMLKQKRPESVTDRITRENYERAIAGELERIQAIHKDITQDRKLAYARAEEEDQGMQEPSS